MAVQSDDYMIGMMTTKMYGSGRSYQDAYARQSDATKSPTVKRPKPKDLWGNQTQVWAERWSRSQTTGNVPHSYYGGGFYIGAAVFGFPGTKNIEALVPKVPPDPQYMQRLLAQIKGQNINVGVAAAELNKTRSMVADLTKQIWLVYKDVRKFRIRNAGRAFERIGRRYFDSRGKIVTDPLAKRWLEYQYGIKPLVSDIHGACEELSNKFQAGQYLFADTGWIRSAEKSYVQTSTFSGTFYFEKSLRARARWKVAANRAQDFTRLGLTNPAEVVWELIPFSFVVDWVLPIGNWLAQFDALHGTEGCLCYLSGRVSQSHFGSAFGGEQRYTYKRVYRNAGEILRYGQVQSLQFQPHLTLNRAISALALAHR